MTSKIRRQRDPITGQLFYFDEDSGKASWTDPSVLTRRNKRLSMKGKILFRKSAKDLKIGKRTLSFDLWLVFTLQHDMKHTLSFDLWLVFTLQHDMKQMVGSQCRLISQRRNRKRERWICGNSHQRNLDWKALRISTSCSRSSLFFQRR